MNPRQILKIACFLWLIVLQTVSSAQPVTTIAGGGDHSLFVKSDGSLWAMGYNSNGQLGDGTTDGGLYYTNSPEKIAAGNVTAMAAGEFHSLFLKNDGSLWVMGYNYYGQLGDGTGTDTNIPEQIVASNVTAIAAGWYHSLFLKSDGSLWATGWNLFGQLGDGTTNNADVPEQIVASNVIAIAAGGIHSMFIKNDGSLWGMGFNGDGELGDGTYNNTSQPVQIVASNVVAVAAGAYHSLFLKNDGSLWAMGYDYYGQLGDGVDLLSPFTTNQPEQIIKSNVTAVAAGYFHSLYLMNDGSLWAMGDNEYGQLGVGNNNNANVPEQIQASNVASIAVGNFHSLFIENDGSLWAMGCNADGQLGDGTINNANSSEQIVSPDFIYTANDGAITITGYTGPGGTVNVPDAINGLPVAIIGTNAFLGTAVTSVTIPASVTNIGDQAFLFCYHLTSVYFQGNAPALGSLVFGYLNFFPPQPTWVVPNCFYLPGTTGWDVYYGGCPTFMLVPPYICTVANNTITISGYTGTGESLVIPDTLASLPVVGLGDALFFGSALTSITVPASVTNIGYWVFANCTSLKSVYFLGNTPATTPPPSYDQTEFDYDNGVTVFYLPGTTGWGTVFGDGPTATGDGTRGGAQTALWLPSIQTMDTSFGVQSNQFGFNINWASDQMVVIEACNDLSNPIWTPVSTNTLTDGASYFSDAQWTYYPGRFYRLRLP
jgi:alpha-tubulin suppressor-like RCC1 family protein